MKCGGNKLVTRYCNQRIPASSTYGNALFQIKAIKVVLICCLLVSCQPRSVETNNTHDTKLVLSYLGEAEVVQFKMFEGLHQILSKDSASNTFTTSIAIPKLQNAVFTYDIIVHAKDSSGRLIALEPQKDLIKVNNEEAMVVNDRFLFVGQKRKANFSKSKELNGSLISKFLGEEMLSERREISIYTPEKVAKDIPLIYCTDGSIVEAYAPYIDKLISSKKIKPIILIGIHSSSSSRYEEYVRGGENNVLFNKHETFVFDQVLKSSEEDIGDWSGKRYFYGFSNGAAFCIYAGLNHPDLFEEIIAFSTADYISAIAQMINPIAFKYSTYPKFYMGAGTYEKSIYNDNFQFVTKMENNDLDVEFREFISGHDYNVWRIEFLEYLEKRFRE